MSLQHGHSIPLKRYLVPAFALPAALLLAACGGGQAPAVPAEPIEARESDAGSPAEVAEPTPEAAPPPPAPEPAFDFMAYSALVGSPQDSVEGTFELYLRDAISQAVRLQQERVDIRVHYEDPTVLEQDLGGLVVDIDLIEDRSTFTYATVEEVSAIYEVDVDILVTYGDEETTPGRCAWTVNLEKVDDLWYVINPTEMALFVNCTT